MAQETMTLAQIQGASETRNLRLIGHSDLAGHGDGCRIDKKDNYLFVAHMGSVALTVLDVEDPRHPRVVAQIPNQPHVHSHKVQVVGDMLLLNVEQPPWDKGPFQGGLRLYDVARPSSPREVGFYPVEGQGVHRFWFVDGRFAHLPCSAEGYTKQIYRIVDVHDPSRIEEVGRWWLPGMWAAGGEKPDWDSERSVWCHEVITWGDRAYVAYEDAGLVILDISNLSGPRLVSRLNLSPPFRGHTHTVLPLPDRQLLVVAEESVRDRCQDFPKMVWVVDVREERNPIPISAFPIPEGDYCARGGRFGPHNVHENRPGSMIDSLLIYLCYFNAGLRVVDISNPFRPSEVGYFIPPAPKGQEAIQINDVYVDAEGLIYVTDRIGGGLYVLEYTGPRPTAPRDPARSAQGQPAT